MEKIKRLLNYLYPKLKSPFFVSMTVSVFIMFIIQDILHFGAKLHFFPNDFENLLYVKEEILRIGRGPEFPSTALFGIRAEFEILMFIAFYYSVKHFYIKITRYEVKIDVGLTKDDRYKKFSMKLFIFLNVFVLIVTPTVAARELFLFLLPKSIDDSIYIKCELGQEHGLEASKKWMFGKEVELVGEVRYGLRAYCFNNAELKIKFSTREKGQFTSYYSYMRILNPIYWIYFLYLVLRSLMGLSN